MELKLDENGNAVLQDGCPVYLYDDGREAPFDAATTLATLNGRISNLEDEKNRHFTKTKEYKEKLKAYEGIDPEKATAAIATVQNLKDKQLLDSQGIEVLKNEMRSSFEAEKKQLTENFTNIIKEREGNIQQQNSMIHELMVTQRFHSSDFFTGEKPKTIYPPDDAAKIFGHHFSVERTNGTNRMQVIARDNDGNIILSRKNHGDPAPFDEAIAIIVDKHPHKHRFLNSPAGGGPDGARGNTGLRTDQKVGHGQSKIAAGLKKQFAGRF
jgi:hypothetical protein